MTSRTIESYMSPQDYAEANPAKVAIMQCLANDMTIVEAAEHMGVAHITAKHHTMGAKLQSGARTTTGALAVMMRLGIIE